MFKPIATLAKQLEDGSATARALVGEALSRIEDTSGEGARAFLTVDAESALAEAGRIDALRAQGKAPSEFAGIPFAVKDLFDIKGEVTRAGSKVLANAAPATRDAAAVAKLKAKGFIVVGRTNMTEFAYSGVGLNPHYGTPRSPYDRATGRIPGGSSSGSAVAVADGMVPLALGTDTGGSCRIPAAYCGVTGYKPSTGRVSKEGAYPLSSTLDAVGPIAQTVQCCAIADAIMAGDWSGEIETKSPRLIRLGLPTTHIRDGLEAPIARAFDRALALLAVAGVTIEDFKFPELAELPLINSKGGISAAEAYKHHRDQIAAHGKDYDRRVYKRIMSGAAISDADLGEILAKRRRLIARCDDLMSRLDALIMPTSPNVPPPISALETDEEYTRLNFLSLKNTFPGNFLDRCAISIPMHRTGEPPAGLMLMAAPGRDRDLFAVAQAAETVLNAVRDSRREI